ncbi:hypothetical protein CR205_14190 [Alteribacter lacisalsi]|uniref:Uncharacterized protein n=1 Tax=Alteribacter lacisalsi TaxID=2045244 RepID=A0A2W0HHC5_9BACI|nr:hypothetical protein [Alteribacter lacisalsi]PYZ96825.1 hypothetical protein CR205_14190 [Alteribacter lacisalsi]
MKKTEYAWLHRQKPKHLLKKADVSEIPFQKKEISRFITLDGQRMALAGSIVADHKGEQFFSVFSVIDENGDTITDERKQRLIHRYTAYLSLGSYLHNLLQVLADQEQNKAADPETLKIFLTESGLPIRTAEFLSEGINPWLIRKLEYLTGRYDRLADETDLSANDFKDLMEEVDQFWHNYKERFSYLNQLAAAGLKPEKIRNPESKEQILRLLDENRTKNRALSSFTMWFQENSTVDGSLESVINRHFKAAHNSMVDPSAARLTGLEKTLLLMIKILKPIIYVIVIPISVLIFIGTGFNFTVLIFPLAFLLVYKPIFDQLNKHLKLKIYYRWLESNRNLDQVESAQIQTDEEVNQVKEMTSVTFRVTALNRSHLCYYFSAVIFIVGVFGLFRDGTTGLALIFIGVGLFFGLIGMIVPKTSLAKTEITFQDHFFMEGKNEMFPAEFTAVNWIEDKNVLRLDRHNKTKFRYVIDENDKDKLPYVAKWAEAKKIDYKIVN